MADLVQIRDDGQVWLTLSGKKVTLRRPTIGEVRLVQDAAVNAGDLHYDLSVTLQEKARGIAEEHGVDLDAEEAVQQEKDAGHEYMVALREVRQQIGRDQQALWVQVGRDLLALLATGGYEAPDDDDDMDPLFLSAALYTRLIRGWTTVPLA